MSLVRHRHYKFCIMAISDKTFLLITILREKFLEIFFHTLNNLWAYCSMLVSTASACYFMLNYVLHWHLDLQFLEPVNGYIFHIFADHNIKLVVAV